MFGWIRRLDHLIGKLSVNIPIKKIEEPQPGEIKKIFCIKFWGLGNLTIIYPLLYKLKEKYPYSKLTFITFDKNKNFLEKNEAVSEIIYFKFTTNIFSIIGQLIGLIIRIRRERVDLLINFETFNNTCALFSRLTGARIRIGLYNDSEKIFFTHPVENDKIRHISEIFCRLLKEAGIDFVYAYHYFPKSANDENRIKDLLESLKPKKIICLHPGTSLNFRGKRYGEEDFSVLSDLLIEKYNAHIFITGIEKEQGLACRIIRKIRNKGMVFNLSGKLDIWEFIELLRKSHLFISSDTGPAHLSASLGINTVVFYGPTSPKRYGPLNPNKLVFYKNLECSPCIGLKPIDSKCKNSFKCMEFPPREILAQIAERFFGNPVEQFGH